MPDVTPGVAMFAAYRQLEQRVMQALHAKGFEDATLAQGRVFARVADDGTRLTELADRAQVTKQTAGFLVDQLERSGYVERVPDPRDARARLVRVAPRGRRAQACARAAEEEVYAEWRAHLGQAEFERVGRALERLREITDPFA